MENELFCLECRYEYFGREGLQWTKWFMVSNIEPSQDSYVLGEQMTAYKKQDKDSKQKLKHEYRVVPYIEIEVPKKEQKKRVKRAKKNKN